MAKFLQVLGAAMFHVKVGESSVVYTGDYNMTPDRHLGSAQIDRLRPDLIITEYITLLLCNLYLELLKTYNFMDVCLCAPKIARIPCNMFYPEK
jgi:hypothetical protein